MMRAARELIILRRQWRREYAAGPLQSQSMHAQHVLPQRGQIARSPLCEDLQRVTMRQLEGRRHKAVGDPQQPALLIACKNSAVCSNAVTTVCTNHRSSC